MRLTTRTIAKHRRGGGEYCANCRKPLTPDSRVFITPEGVLFCSPKCAEAWKAAGGPAT